MRRTLAILSMLLIAMLACTLSGNTAPANEIPTVVVTPALVEPSAVMDTPAVVEPATTTPEVFISVTQAIPATLAATTKVTYGRLSFEIPAVIAAGASGRDVAPITNDDAAAWEKTPGHLLVSLGDYYVLQGKFLQPQIYVFPAMPYVELSPAAFESMHRLRNVLNPGASITADQLPSVSFFTAAQVFASNIQTLSFQNGSGVRFLSEYAQYPAPVNNHELVYCFQGFTDDGEYYIVAILPVTAPLLAETADAGSPLPTGGIMYPFFADPDVETLQKYYADVANLLEDTPSEAFTPSIAELDRMIQSMLVAP